MFIAYFKPDKEFGYVYDDTDDTCEVITYQELECLTANGVDLRVRKTFSRLQERFILKCRLIYNIESAVRTKHVFHKHICKYQVGCLILNCYLRVKSCKCSFLLNALSIDRDFKIKNKDKFIGVDAFKETQNTLKLRDVNKYPVKNLNDYNNDDLEFDIPVEMFFYILSLYSNRDFEGIVKVFNNYIGCKLVDIVDYNFGGGKIDLKLLGFGDDVNVHSVPFK